MSLVQGQSRRRHAALLSRFAAAFAGSAVTVFAVAGAIGAAAGYLLPTTARLVVAWAVLCAALILDAYSLRHKTWCPVTARRQTPKTILLQYGERRAAVAWGLDTGLIFTTYRMSAISWALLALAAVGIAPWWLGLGYAAGFLTPLVLGSTMLRLRADAGDATGLARALARRPQIARATCVAVLAGAIILTGGALTS